VSHRKIFSGAALALVTLYLTAAAQAQPRVEVGVLNCNVAGGSGFVFGSTKRLRCVFNRPGRDERYVGIISKFGIDIGTTQQSAIAWAVLAPTVDIPPGALVGNYGGVSGEATVGVGLGANALIGGSNRSFALQPLSIQAQQGLNVAAGIAALELRLAP
jgi:Protein of unknown function (DUF992)